MNNSLSRFAVIGFPIAHSRSPLIHNHWFEAHQKQAHYEAVEVPPENLASFLSRLPQTSFAGLNITIPHKEAAFAWLAAQGARFSPLAQKLAAVNVIDCKAGLAGDNVDGAGFLDSLPQNWQPASSPAVILGAGGAAAAILLALIEAGQKHFRLLNRTQSRAEALAEKLSASGIDIEIEIGPWRARGDALAEASLLVNTTSLGMKGGKGLELDLEALPQQALVADIIYNPWHTPLLMQAQNKGHKIINGAEMLLGQAARSFDLWFGIRPAITPALRSLLRDAVEKGKQP